MNMKYAVMYLMTIKELFINSTILMTIRSQLGAPVPIARIISNSVTFPCSSGARYRYVVAPSHMDGA